MVVLRSFLVNWWLLLRLYCKMSMVFTVLVGFDCFYKGFAVQDFVQRCSHQRLGELWGIVIGPADLHRGVYHFRDFFPQGRRVENPVYGPLYAVLLVDCSGEGFQLKDQSCVDGFLLLRCCYFPLLQPLLDSEERHATACQNFCREFKTYVRDIAVQEEFVYFCFSRKYENVVHISYKEVDLQLLEVFAQLDTRAKPIRWDRHVFSLLERQAAT